MENNKWQNKLSDKAYQVTRCGGTEAAFTGKYNKHDDDGLYLCQCCKAELFSSEHKYDSGSGWPSFYQAFKSPNILEKKDSRHGMIRIEVCCKHCDAHLGHVFTDGPQPTGLRYCINSLSLDFKKSQE